MKTKNNDTNNNTICKSSNLEHPQNTHDSTSNHQRTTLDNHQSLPVESSSNKSSTNIAHAISAEFPNEKR